MSEVITFTSGKGGVGKTTTTANVGVGLSLLEKKVILIDTDIGLRNLDVVMGLENRIVYNLVDVLTGKCRVKQAVIRDRRYPNLSVIPSACVREHPPITTEAMQTLMEELKESYDYILVDSTELLGVVLEDEHIIISQNHGESMMEKRSTSRTCYENICRRLVGEAVPIPDFLQEKHRFRGFFWNKPAKQTINS